jgi:hypothetical protein
VSTRGNGHVSFNRGGVKDEGKLFVYLAGHLADLFFGRCADYSLWSETDLNYAIERFNEGRCFSEERIEKIYSLASEEDIAFVKYVMAMWNSSNVKNKDSDSVRVFLSKLVVNDDFLRQVECCIILANNLFNMGKSQKFCELLYNESIKEGGQRFNIDRTRQIAFLSGWITDEEYVASL